MSKPEIYKGQDAVKVKCVKQYAVKDGSDDPVTYQAGKTYAVSPSSAVHLLRKVFNLRKEVKGKMQYVGDAPHFIDVAVAVADAKAEADAKAGKPKK